MNRIDRYAYITPLKNTHPGEKIFFSLGTMLVTLTVNSGLISTLVIIVMSVLIIGKARVEPKFYLQLLAVPSGFLLPGCMAVALNISLSAAEYDYVLKVGGIFIGVTHSSLEYALILLARSLAALNCLYFLILTTPVNQIINILQKLKVPSVILNLMVMIYNNIFVFIDCTQEIYIAQVSRYGYHNFFSRIKSLALLCSSLFIKSLQTSHNAFDCLVSRGFNGEIKLASEVYETKMSNIAATLVLNGLLLGIYWSGRF